MILGLYLTISCSLAQPDWDRPSAKRLMHHQIRYAGRLWDVSAWRGPGPQGRSDYVVVKADGRTVFSTKEQQEPARVGIGFLAGADRVPYIIFRQYANAGSAAWTKIFRMKSDGRAQVIFEEDNYDNVFHTARDIGGPVFRDLDGDGHEEWIWDDFTSYDPSPDPAENLVAFKPGKDGVLKVWKVIPNRHKIRLPLLGGIASEGDKRIFFMKY